jgi:hypothetical protein
MKYRTKPEPVTIEARLYRNDASSQDLCNWINEGWYAAGRRPAQLRNGALIVPTPEGEQIASDGDWVIKGIAGEFYPCKPDIFAATYEPAEDA